ncbi:MAG TPA: glycosyltransferase family 39 protein [Sphingomicrobium sp.]|nr:glycosyltransferase family 39 protein [Sphingomicrobium sp.]
MASVAIPARRLPSLPQGHWPVLAVALLALAIVAINPVGFLGVGSDDAQYLEAARCWVADAAPCLPGSHWWTRWPVVAPLALSTGVLGESRWTVGLGPLLYWAATLGLVGWLGGRWFDRATGYLAAAFLALTPAFAAAALQPTADIAEIAWQLAALAAATLAIERRSRRLAVAAGAFAGVAFAARDTSVLFIAAAAIAWWLSPAAPRRLLAWAAAGLAAVVVGEMLVYGLVTGDPLWRFALAAGHAGIPSTELPASVDTSSAPFFNPDYIMNWKREMDIRFFWPLDPWLNLLASPRIMQILIAPLVLAAAYRQLLSAQDRHRLKRLVGLALLVAALLVYALAIDPKPRMFMALAAACAMSAGALASSAWASGHRLLPGFVAAGCAVCGFYFMAIWGATYDSEVRARQWIAAHPGRMEVDRNARGYLMLVAEARDLPLAGSGRPLLVTVAGRACADEPPAARARLLLEALGGPNPAQRELCLWAYR